MHGSDDKQVMERRHLFGIFRYIRPEWKAYMVGAVFLFTCDALQFSVPQILGFVVDRLVGGEAGEGTLLRPILESLLGWRTGGGFLFASAGLILGIAVIVAFFRFLWRYFIVGASIRIDRGIREDLFAHLLKLPRTFYHDTPTGDLMARATNDIRQIQMAAGFGMVIMVDTLVMGTVALILMFGISGHLTLLALIPLSLVGVLVVVVDPAIRRLYERMQRTFSKLTERLRENIAGIRVVKAYVQEQEEIDSFSGLSGRYVMDNLRLVRLWGALFPSILAFMGIATAVCLFVGGRYVILGVISMGEFVEFTAYLGMLAWPIMAVGWVISMFQRGTVSMGRITQILEEETVRSLPEVPEKTISPSAGSLEVRDLTFAYEPDQAPVLKGVSFSLPPGGKLGVVGRVGSGKSSLLALLMRLWEPPPGTIFVDSMDVTRISLEELRRRFSWIPQESFLFSDTIEGNIAFGAPEATGEEIRDAARRAQIHEAIEGFRDGYSTRVGERGVTLSGGERQRTSIARAWLTGAPILLLDDCLSAVDADTEKEIIQNLVEATGGRTCIIVSHRVSAVEWADEILVLDEGAVAERGTHEALARSRGLYADMVQKQQAEMRLESLGESKEKEAGDGEEEEA
ncbi:MAG: ABC transporter ATP-binding protein [Planctomycetota bacterium]|jgi:ATP-binding cassette subfamily B protein